MIPEIVVDWAAVGATLRAYRETRRINLSNLAAAMGGVDKDVLSRLERGGIVRADNLFWICPWLGVLPARFYRTTALPATIPIPPPAPLTRLMAHVAAAGQEAVIATAQAAGVAGDLVTQVATAAVQAISRAIATPPPDVFAPDFLVSLTPGQVVDWPAFGQAMQERRAKESLDDVAAAIGAISVSSLSRLERGGVANADTLFRLCLWLQKSPDHFYRATALLALPGERRPAVLDRLARHTAQIVEKEVAAAVEIRGLTGDLAQRLTAAAAHVASQTLLTAPPDMFPPPPQPAT